MRARQEQGSDWTVLGNCTCSVLQMPPSALSLLYDSHATLESTPSRQSPNSQFGWQPGLRAWAIATTLAWTLTLNLTVLKPPASSSSDCAALHAQSCTKVRPL